MKHTIKVRQLTDEEWLKKHEHCGTRGSLYRQALNDLVIDLEGMPKIDSASVSQDQVIINTNLEKRELANSTEYLFKAYFDRIRINEELFNTH